MRLAATLVAFWLATAASQASPIELRARALSLALSEPAAGVEALGGWTLAARTPRFGGLSGLAFTEAGARLLAVSDQGLLLTVDVRRAPNGAILRFDHGNYAALRDRSGAPLRGRGQDAEALALRDGVLWVAFERRHRLEARDASNAALTRTLPFPDVGMRRNEGLEGLAIAADGALYMIAEEPPQGATTFALWRYVAGRLSRFDIARRDGFAATGLDIGPDGRLYLLERRFSLFGGFAARLRRFELDASGAPRDETSLFVLRDGVDNMEGVVVDRAIDGRLVATLISDDNLNGLQSTQLFQVRLPD